MKKLFALLLAVMLIASMAVAVSAESTTTLTTTVPAATYTLNIPADQEIPFGTTGLSIGNLSVTNATGFAEGKNLKVTMTYDAFSCEDTSTTIPFDVAVSINEYWNDATASFRKDITSGGSVTFFGLEDGTTNTFVMHDKESSNEYKYFQIHVNSTDWGKALAGDYAATITFTAEVVVE